MFRICLVRCSSRRMAPTLTVSRDGTACVPITNQVTSSSSRTWKDRIIRPLTEEEENYEILRVQKNAKTNLKMKGKQSVQVSRRNSSHNSYDQI
jgi:hypothetical protein